MKTINFGFIGAGQIAHFSASSVVKHTNAKLIAAQDLNAERLSDLMQAFDIPNGYETAEALLACPEIDAVYIAVPNKFHAPLAKQALEAGKHVILDKPFAFSHAEALEVAEVAERTGKTFFLGMNQRFVSDHQKVRSLVREGRLGEVYHAKAWWFRRSGIPKLGTWFCSKEMAGGGCLYDIGVHLLDLCLYVIDNFKPVSVSGATYTKFGDRGLGEGSWGISDRSEGTFDVDDFATAMIRFENGASVSLDVSWACHAAEHDRMDVQLYGTLAGATLNPAKLYKNGEKASEYQITEKLGAAVEYEHCDRFSNFINHLLGEEALGVTIDQALVVQKILDAIEESNRTGCEVRFD